MSSSRNCLNCGAPYDVSLTNCPYCGTSYFDMSALDLGSGKPIVLKIRYGNCIITQLVIPKFDSSSITIENDICNCCNGIGVPVVSFNRGYEISTDIHFVAVAPSNEDAMMQIRVLE